MKNEKSKKIIVLSTMTTKAEMAHNKNLFKLIRALNVEFGRTWRTNLFAKAAFYQGHFNGKGIKSKVTPNFHRCQVDIASEKLTYKEKDNARSRWNQIKKMKIHA